MVMFVPVFIGLRTDSESTRFSGLTLLQQLF